ncbi:MAG: UDP-N-acetylmuramate--L-alanine ligase [bacterium]|nr:UDP-N-acetylmuramate--L-alanine ligase [bacterium]
MHVHFVGIGGIGVSALAKYYLSTGALVSGSDLKPSEITRELEKLGAKIKIGTHNKKNIPKDTNLVIYTPAVVANNKEIEEAHKRDLTVLSYPQAVGELTWKYKTITISGTHGKSTTTAMIGLVLTEGYFDPTVIIGSKVREFGPPAGGSNFRKGLGHHLVLEADEWNRSLLNYHPTIAVMTNVDADHLDTYGNIESIEKTFVEYLAKVPDSGKIVANADDPRLKKIVKKFGEKVIWFSLRDKEAPKIASLLKIPGEHNVSNALAALKLGRYLGIHEPDILRALSQFQGIWRRFEFKGMIRGAFVYTDYGHHPSEIRATIKAAREKFPIRRIVCVYQPHQYQRLGYLWDDFVEAFDMVDLLCLVPVYDVAGRETKEARKQFNSEKLAQEIARRGKEVHHLKDQKEAVKFIQSHAHSGDVIIVMGAGDIYDIFSTDFLEKK